MPPEPPRGRLPSPLWQVALSPLLGAAVTLAGAGVGGLVRSVTGGRTTPASFAEFFGAHAPLGAFLMLLLGAGIMEELIYRYGLQNALSRWLGPQAGWLLSAVAFGLYHVLPGFTGIDLPGPGVDPGSEGGGRGAARGEGSPALGR